MQNQLTITPVTIRLQDLVEPLVQLYCKMNHLLPIVNIMVSGRTDAVLEDSYEDCREVSQVNGLSLVEIYIYIFFVKDFLLLLIKSFLQRDDETQNLKGKNKVPKNVDNQFSESDAIFEDGSKSENRRRVREMELL